MQSRLFSAAIICKLPAHSSSHCSMLLNQRCFSSSVVVTVAFFLLRCLMVPASIFYVVALALFFLLMQSMHTYNLFWNFGCCCFWLTRSIRGGTIVREKNCTHANSRSNYWIGWLTRFFNLGISAWNALFVKCVCVYIKSECMLRLRKCILTKVTNEANELAENEETYTQKTLKKINHSHRNCSEMVWLVNTIVQRHLMMTQLDTHAFDLINKWRHLHFNSFRAFSISFQHVPNHEPVHHHNFFFCRQCN